MPVTVPLVRFPVSDTASGTVERVQPRALRGYVKMNRNKAILSGSVCVQIWREINRGLIKHIKYFTIGFRSMMLESRFLPEAERQRA